MSLGHGASIVKNDLVLHLDAANVKSYPGTGTVWKDLSKNHDVTLYNSVAWSSSNAGTFTLNGTNNVISTVSNIPITSPISLTSSFTIEQIFTPTGYQTSAYYGLINQLLVKGYSANTYNYATQCTNNTTFSFVKRNASEDLKFTNWTVPAMLNQINFMTITVAGPSITLYVNGTPISTQTITGTAIAPSANDKLAISPSTISNTYFIGKYYSAKIYSRALLASEVQQNFEALRGRYGI
jgi:hypothetical protein